MTTLSARSIRQICASAVGYRIDVLFKDICTDGIKILKFWSATLKIHDLAKRFHMCHEQQVRFKILILPVLFFVNLIKRESLELFMSALQLQ